MFYITDPAEGKFTKCICRSKMVIDIGTRGAMGISVALVAILNKSMKNRHFFHIIIKRRKMGNLFEKKRSRRSIL